MSYSSQNHKGKKPNSKKNMTCRLFPMASNLLQTCERMAAHLISCCLYSHFKSMVLKFWDFWVLLYLPEVLLSFHDSLLKLSCLLADTHHPALPVLEATEHKQLWKTISSNILDTQLYYFQSSFFLNCFLDLLFQQRQIICLFLFK